MAKGMPVATALQQLGLTNTANEKEVKQAYKDLARIWHPDRFQNDERLGARTEAQIKLINEARTVAMAYLEKYGHFHHVGREQKQKPNERPSQKQPPGDSKRPPRAEQAPPRPKQEAPPKKEKTRKRPEKPEAEEKQSRPTRPAPETNFQMEHGNLVIFFILLLLVGFLVMLGSSLLNPPEDKIEKLTKKIELSNEKSELRKQWDAKRAKDSVVVDRIEVIEPVVAELDTFFTLGSNKAWVSKVQGPPHQIKGREWHYGSSIIHFGGGGVIGWASTISDPLKMGMAVDSIWYFPNPYFEIGSFKEEVIALQGAPDIIENKIWTFGEAIVEFDSDTVAYYDNDAQNTLKVR